MMQLVIDPEFRAYLPKLDESERKHLEEMIQKEGCRDAIIAWNGTIIDGHNRFEICTAYDIEYRVEQMEFESREDVLEWMDINAISRRNLDPKERTLRIGRIYERRKKKHGGARRGEISSPQVADLKTAEQVAQEFGVNKSTVERAGERAVLHAAMVDAGDEEAADIVKSMPQKEVKQALKELKQVVPPNLTPKKPAKKISPAAEAKKQEQEAKRAEREAKKAAAEKIKRENAAKKAEEARRKQEAKEIAARMTAFEKARAVPVATCDKLLQLVSQSMTLQGYLLREIDDVRRQRDHANHALAISECKELSPLMKDMSKKLKSIKERLEQWG